MDDILQVPIIEYLNGIGIITRKEGNKYFASSPFSSDRNWSFVIYPTNTYFDFSTGHGGNILNLVSRINNTDLSTAARLLKEGIKYEKYQPNYKQYKQEPEFWEDFKVEKYTNTYPEEIKAIDAYAKSRGITEGYFPGVFFTRNRQEPSEPWIRKIGSGWQRTPALGFLHVDKNLKPCGAKFRRIVPQEGSNDQSARFSARGCLGWYIQQSLSGLASETVKYLYVVESESSANSLNAYFSQVGHYSVVASRGGVSSAPKLSDLPEKYQGLPIKLIIDYDGNEELYNQRLKLYKDLGAQPIKLILPKGEDLNSLYIQNKMWLVRDLL